MAFKGEQQITFTCCSAKLAKSIGVFCIVCHSAYSPRIGTKDYAKEAPILGALDEGDCHLFCICQHV